MDTLTSFFTRFEGYGDIGASALKELMGTLKRKYLVKAVGYGNMAFFVVMNNFEVAVLEVERNEVSYGKKIRKVIYARELSAAVEETEEDLDFIKDELDRLSKYDIYDVRIREDDEYISFDVRYVKYSIRYTYSAVLDPVYKVCDLELLKDLMTHLKSGAFRLLRPM